MQSVTIPSTTIYLGQQAFMDCSSLVSVQLNEGLQIIGPYAFKGCTSLRVVTIPSTVTNLGWRAFENCSGLIELRLNEGLQVIGERAFYSCTSLRYFTVPSSVINCGERAFAHCTGLVEIQLREGLQTIGASAFANCTALRSVTIPSTVTELGVFSFFGCRNLSEVILLDGKMLLNREFVDCDFEREEEGLLDQKAIDWMLFDEDENFAFLDCPLTEVKISISWAVSERMARLPRGCRLSIEERIHDLRRLEVQNDGNVLACFHVVRMAPDTEFEDDSEDEFEDDAFAVRDTSHETATSLNQLLQLIAFHELKESSIVIELAMWKSRIDSDRARTDCRVAIPDPAKTLIMEYGGFTWFLRPAIEGA